jgi:hypothetical protein
LGLAPDTMAGCPQKRSGHGNGYISTSSTPVITISMSVNTGLDMLVKSFCIELVMQSARNQPNA